jgi:hypothetical protein
MPTKKLPIFNDYFIDIKLKQFRKVNNNRIFFIDFNSIRGQKILEEYIDFLDLESDEFKEIISVF